MAACLLRTFGTLAWRASGTGFVASARGRSRCTVTAGCAVATGIVTCFAGLNYARAGATRSYCSYRVFSVPAHRAFLLVAPAHRTWTLHYHGGDLSHAARFLVCRFWARLLLPRRGGDGGNRFSDGISFVLAAAMPLEQHYILSGRRTGRTGRRQTGRLFDTAAS